MAPDDATIAGKDVGRSSRAGRLPDRCGYRTQPIDNPPAPPLILVADDIHEAAESAVEARGDVGYRGVVADSAEATTGSSWCSQT